MPIPLGTKVFVIGVGNVMTDIVRFLASQPQVEEITTIARRGPAEVKFDQRELEPVAPYLDAADFDREIARVTPVMESVGQDPRTSVKDIEEQLGRVEEHRKKPVWKIRFLYSPLAMLSNDGATVSALQLEENILEAQGNTTVAKGTGKKVEEPADTVVFAIGDRVDDNLGIPLRGNEYRIADSPHFPVDGTSFELMDESDPHRLDGVFVAGWSRKSSTGMAGVARKDGTNAARAIQAYLNGSDNFQSIDPLALEDELAVRGYRAVTMRSLMKLENAEKDMAQKQGLPEFKFDSDEEMLELMGL
jgi:ferredoxin--NADP+ reductase